MKTIRLLLLTILCLSGLNSCEYMADAKWGTRLYNNSDKLVYFTVSFEQIGGKYVPSTKWPDESWQLRPAREHSNGEFLLGWRSVSAKSTDSIAVFVFDPDTLSKYTWAEIERDKNYLKVYKMKYSDLPVGSGRLYYP